MLYLALGASLLQHLLSIGRLAPLQLLFGLGHPVTSGHPGVDFFVFSDLFEGAPETEPDCRMTAMVECAESVHVLEYYDKNDNMQKYAPAAAAAATKAAVYTEQLVLFDSFTGVFVPRTRNPSLARARAARNRLLALAASVAQNASASVAVPVAAAEEAFGGDKGVWKTSPYSAAAAESTCSDDCATGLPPGGAATRDTTRSHPTVYSVREVLNRTVETRGKETADIASRGGVNLTSDNNNNIGEKAVSPDNNDHDKSGINFYHCLQDPKKFHPAFDVAMRSVLERDPGAWLLLPESAKIHFNRWNHTLKPVAAAGPAGQVEEERLKGMFPPGGVGGRLLFLPEMEHSEMMEVVAACDVMLAPWGWEAGITSFEALAVGLPVVTAPSEESVLHFSRGQVGVVAKSGL